jgi:hypothetical protein
MAILLCLLSCFQNSFCQRNSQNFQTDSMFFFGMGLSKLSINRLAFDQWTRANYNLTESYNLNTYIDLDYIGGRYDLGLNFNLGSAFSTDLVYLGVRLTSPRSKIASWLNFEVGEFQGVFTNIAPVNYTLTPDQVGQKLELHYKQGYIGLTSKNFLNFLHFNTRLGKTKVPFNSGFFVSAGYQPGHGTWRYGYYNSDTVFVSNKVRTIPKLGNVQVRAGVFAGF